MDHEEGHPRQAFDPDTVAAINRVYEGAVISVGVQTAHSDLRVAIARHIMHLAMSGETDETKLREAAAAQLAAHDKPIAYTGL